METGEPLGKKIVYIIWKFIMTESSLEESLNDYNYSCLRHTLETQRLKFGNLNIRTLAKVMGFNVTYIEQYYDCARVENMTDYITRGFNKESKDAFGDVILR